MEFVAAIVGAFFLFLVVLPLLGIGVGMFLRILAPYLFGGGLIYLLMKQFLSHSGAWWEYTVPLIAWAALVLGTRLMDNCRQALHEGHWRAVMVVVTFGLWRQPRLDAPLMEDCEMQESIV